MRIVRLANFVTPRSGGLRTALRALGEGYVAAGHEAVLIVPGERDDDEQTPSGRVITLRGVPVPFAPGYRMILGRSRVRGLLEELRPDRVEVSDRLTLRWTGRWARAHGIGSMMISHETVDGLLGEAMLPRPLRRLIADQLNGRTLRSYDTVVCTTAWAAAEFERLGPDRLGAAGPDVARLPLGVDLGMFRPDLADPDLRRHYARDDQVLLVHCGRLSTEKRPGRSIEALAALRRRGVDAVLLVAGHGPMRERLRKQAQGLPVRFLDFVSDRTAVATLLATADVVIAPGPLETFCLAALESLACGTPVVVDGRSAASEVVGDAGAAVDSPARAGRAEGAAFADGVQEVLARDEHLRRKAARARAEQFSWAASVAGFLDAHGL